MPLHQFDELRNALRLAKTNFLIGYHFWAIPVHTPKRFEQPIPEGRRWPSLEKDYADLARLTQEYRDLELNLWRNYERSLARALIKEGYELVLHYCELTNQKQCFQDWPTKRFYRMLRNAFSHTTGGTIKWTYGNSPIAWRQYTYTSVNDGDQVSIETREALELHEELQDFAEKLA